MKETLRFESETQVLRDFVLRESEKELLKHYSASASASH